MKDLPYTPSKLAYLEWEPIYEFNSGMKIYDDDGYRHLVSIGKQDEPMSYEEVQKYLLMCTLVPRKGNV